MKLNYKQFGEGPALIILHGLFGSLDNWQTLARKYAEHFTVYIVDQRNHGKSPHSEDMSLKHMADDIHSFMQEHHIDQSHFIGHSMGGKVVQHLALKHPARCSRIISADIGIKQYARGHDDIFHALQQLDVETIKSRKHADELLEAAIPEFGVRLFILKGLQRTENGYHWKFNIPALWSHYDQIIAATKNEQPSKVFIHFLSGEQSNYVQTEDHSSIQDLFPNATFDTVSNANHWLHADNPVEFYKKSLNYLR